MANLILKGVRQNNLKNIDVELPLGKAIIVTGPSGSGKSSLAFETIYAEGQRRYLQSLSTYARQFLEKFQPPDLESVENIPPTIAIEQYNPVRNSRATVGTTTELYDYLRLLYEKIGRVYCENCNVPMEKLSAPQIFEWVVKEYKGKTILLAFKKQLPKSGKEQKPILDEILRSGFTRVILDGQVFQLEEYLDTKKKSDTLFVVVDRLKAQEKDGSRFSEAFHLAERLGDGVAQLIDYEEIATTPPAPLTLLPKCPKCHRLGQIRTAQHFSFNNPLGACETCKGFGNTLEVDENLILPNPKLSLRRGAIEPFTKPSLRSWFKKMLAFCESERIDADLPFNELPPEHKVWILNGHKKFRGVRGVFALLEKEKYKLRIRVFVSRYTSPFKCKACNGTRVKPSALFVRIGGLNIAEVSTKSFAEAATFIDELELTAVEKKIATDILRQLKRRLSYLSTVGLGYLTLSRLTRSLSGGEYQRILLATQLSQGLTDTLYVLDEPSIGLHSKDTERLIEVLNDLRSQGNSLVVVEHDPELIEWGDYVVDLGPGSGRYGGEITFSGSQSYFQLSTGITANAVKQWRDSCKKELLKSRDKKYDKWLEIRGAKGNNLQNIDVKVPLGALVTITGVSGSGKSTLIVDTLYQALCKIFRSQSEPIARFESIRGFEFLSGVELIDQEPIGKSSRSNPITFMKGYDEIRSLFAGTREAIEKHLAPGHFSFNVPGGRCETCAGEGRIAVDMVFLEDVWVPCQTCDEKRFKPSVLAVKYRGKNIDDVLHMTIDDAYDFFTGSTSLRAKFSILREVGLGYLQLGQPSYTLSGGEAQRIKIARELSGASHYGQPRLYILDEPTTGLHFNEVSRLLSVLRRLVYSGHSVIVIEHNLQVISAADYLIDLGPEGGMEGGFIVFAGSPKDLAEQGLPQTGKYLAELIK